jgi:predicted SnoaL-like aldol condensation-catalyzing enzyme
MGVEANKELVRRLQRELMESRNLDAVDRFFSERFVSHNTPPGLPPGVAGVKAFMTGLRDTLPDLEVEIDQLVAEGDWVAVATTMRSGKVAVTGVDMVRFDDGRIVEHRGLTDLIGLARQLRQA